MICLYGRTLATHLRIYRLQSKGHKALSFVYLRIEGCAGFCVNGKLPRAKVRLSEDTMTKKHEVPEELLSGLLANYNKPEDLIGENGLLTQLTKLLVEKALDAELTEHLSHER